ncbi:Ctr copper transporter [Ophiocordyceps camponoti-floridani]|uniref:Copper transport protein n=1 Tax=Ophiocordyceps camponoti-floridani TaxID=2030778 RepID=A0A8H4VE08_9HYPO|nr:Ctr copper transporter [Ophiocordyceps camponoti-floridani]
MDHAHMDMGSGDAADCKISMLWNWYTIDACFLSPGWHIRNGGMFAATCLGVIALVVFVELLRRLGKEYDAFILRQARRHFADRYADEKSFDSSVVTFRATVPQQLIRSAIHAGTFGGAYIVMLLAMYFNGFVILCIFIGAGLGKFLCDWMVLHIDVDQGRVSDGPHKGSGIEDPSVCCG